MCRKCYNEAETRSGGRFFESIAAERKESESSRPIILTHPSQTRVGAKCTPPPPVLMHNCSSDARDLGDREGQKMRAEIACSRHAGHDNDGPITIGTMTMMTITMTVVLEDPLQEGKDAEEEKRNLGSAFEKKNMLAIARHIVTMAAYDLHKYMNI